MFQHVKQAHCGTTYHLFYINYLALYSELQTVTFIRLFFCCQTKHSHCKVPLLFDLYLNCCCWFFNEHFSTEWFGNDQIPEPKKRFQGKGLGISQALGIRANTTEPKGEKCVHVCVCLGSLALVIRIKKPTQLNTFKLCAVHTPVLHAISSHLLLWGAAW